MKVKIKLTLSKKTNEKLKKAKIIVKNWNK